MSKSVIACLCLSTAAMVAFVATGGRGQDRAKLPMMSQFVKGQQVKLERAISGGYNVNILNDQYVASFKAADRNYVSPKVIDVGLDCIVVDIGNGFEQTISFQAIDVITKLPVRANSPPATEPEKKSKSE